MVIIVGTRHVPGNRLHSGGVRPAYIWKGVFAVDSIVATSPRYCSF